MFDRQRWYVSGKNCIFTFILLYLNWNFFGSSGTFDDQIFVLQDQHMELYSCFLAQLWCVLPVYLEAFSISNSFEFLKHILFLTYPRRQLNKSLFNNSVYLNLITRLLRWFALTIFMFVTCLCCHDKFLLLHAVVSPVKATYMCVIGMYIYVHVQTCIKFYIYICDFWVGSLSEETPCYHVHRISCQSPSL